MGLVRSLNPFNYGNLLVDKMVGDAFPIVKKVYDNMDKIHQVAGALSGSVIGEPMLLQRAILEEGTTGNANTTSVIEFTDVDTNYLNILNSSVRILGDSGKLYFNDSGYFTYYVDNIGLHLTLKVDAPADVQTAIVQWFIVYGGDD